VECGDGTASRTRTCQNVSENPDPECEEECEGPASEERDCYAGCCSDGKMVCLLCAECLNQRFSSNVHINVYDILQYCSPARLCPLDSGIYAVLVVCSAWYLVQLGGGRRL
jgi:hypothetical protein